MPDDEEQIIEEDVHILPENDGISHTQVFDDAVAITFVDAEHHTAQITLQRIQLEDIRANTLAHIDALTVQRDSLEEDSDEYLWFDGYINFSNTALTEINSLISSLG